MRSPETQVFLLTVKGGVERVVVWSYVIVDVLIFIRLIVSIVFAL